MKGMMDGWISPRVLALTRAHNLLKNGGESKLIVQLKIYVTAL